jgi:hypothetical protein
LGFVYDTGAVVEVLDIPAYLTRLGVQPILNGPGYPMIRVDRQEKSHRQYLVITVRNSKDAPVARFEATFWLPEPGSYFRSNNAGFPLNLVQLALSCNAAKMILLGCFPEKLSFDQEVGEFFHRSLPTVEDKPLPHWVLSSQSETPTTDPRDYMRTGVFATDLTRGEQVELSSADVRFRIEAFGQEIRGYSSPTHVVTYRPESIQSTLGTANSGTQKIVAETSSVVLLQGRAKPFFTVSCRRGESGSTVIKEFSASGELTRIVEREISFSASGPVMVRAGASEWRQLTMTFVRSR